LYSVVHIENLTVVAELKRVINVFAERLKLETPFTDAATICLRGFFMAKLSGSNRFFPDCLKWYIENEYYKKQDRSAPDNLRHDTRPKKRDHDLYSTCEFISFFHALDSWKRE